MVYKMVDSVRRNFSGQEFLFTGRQPGTQEKQFQTKMNKLSPPPPPPSRAEFTQYAVCVCLLVEIDHNVITGVRNFKK